MGNRTPAFRVMGIFYFSKALWVNHDLLHDRKGARLIAATRVRPMLLF